MLPMLLGLGALGAMLTKKSAPMAPPSASMAQYPALAAPRCEDGLPCDLAVLTWFNHRSSDPLPSGGPSGGEA